eukprot:1060020-Rhodomonas_salina.1
MACATKASTADRRCGAHCTWNGGWVSRRPSMPESLALTLPVILGSGLLPDPCVRGVRAGARPVRHESEPLVHGILVESRPFSARRERSRRARKRQRDQRPRQACARVVRGDLAPHEGACPPSFLFLFFFFFFFSSPRRWTLPEAVRSHDGTDVHCDADAAADAECVCGAAPGRLLPFLLARNAGGAARRARRVLQEPQGHRRCRSALPLLAAAM